MSAIGPRPVLNETTYTSFDGDTFPYRKWVPKGATDLVVVGFHGIAGASVDLKNLGEHLQEDRSGVAVYAPDLRGQGNDPQVSRRGDIGSAEEWFEDAYTFSRLVRARHPKARVVWCGESMGSLIALHAVARAGKEPPCDALILSSPIAAIRDDLPAWRRQALRVGAFVCPGCKISLESLSGQDEVQVTRDVVHQDQVQSNPYHLPAFTFRLLNTLGNLIEGMPRQAGRVDLPVLILYGGMDIFSRPADVEAFLARFPASDQVQRKYYPQSYHLLFYDHENQKVLNDVTKWLKRVVQP